MSVTRPAPVLTAWLVTVAIDFLVFGGIAAGLLEERGGPGVLAPDSLFRRIPAGYASFLVLVVLVGWVVDRRPVDRPVDGLAVGGVLGGGVGVAMAAAVWSFTTVPWEVLAIWAVTITLQLAGAGWVLVAVASRGRRAIWQAIGGSVVLFGFGVAVQNLG